MKENKTRTNKDGKGKLSVNTRLANENVLQCIGDLK